MKYIIEQETELKEGYCACDTFDAREEFILKFMLKHDKNNRSVVAKLAKMGIYKARPKVSSVTGTEAETKIQILAKIEEIVGSKLEGMDKTPKITLVCMLKYLKGKNV